MYQKLKGATVMAKLVLITLDNGYRARLEKDEGGIFMSLTDQGGIGATASHLTPNDMHAINSAWNAIL
jgi:hypothetical protein